MFYLNETIKYARDCISDKILSCLRHKQVCQRFLNDIELIKTGESEYYWSEEWAEMLIKFTKMLTYKEGDLSNKPVDLMDFQKFILFNIFCIRNKKTNKRKYNSVWIQISRKNAKTQLLAIILLIKLSIESVFWNEKQQSQCCGNGFSKSMDIINECKSLMENTLLEKYNKFTIRSDYIMHNKTKSKLTGLNEKSMHKDGAKLSMLLIDEFHEFDDKKAEVINRARGFCSKDNLLAIISTAGVNQSYKQYSLYLKYCNMLDGILPLNDNIFIDIYELDKEDWSNDVYNIDNKNFIKSNPMKYRLESGRQQIDTDYEDIKIDNSNLSDFLAKIAGIWYTNTNKYYLDFNKYEKCIIPQEEEQYYKDIIKNSKNVFCGLDMSRKHDLSAFGITCSFYNQKTKQVEYIIDSHAFLPNLFDLNRKCNKDNIDYNRYINNNELTIQTEEELNQMKIYEYMINFMECKYGMEIDNKNKLIGLKNIAYDPAFCQMLALEMSKVYDIWAINQNHKSLNEATLTFREFIYTKKIHVFKNSLFDLCVTNAVTTSYMNFIKIDKTQSNFKIDNLDAVINSFKSAIFNTDLDKKQTNINNDLAIELLQQLNDNTKNN